MVALVPAAQGVGRAQPGVVVDLAAVDDDGAAGRGGGEEPGGEAAGPLDRRHPVGEPHQRRPRQHETGLLLRLAHRRGAGGGGEGRIAR